MTTEQIEALKKIADKAEADYQKACEYRASTGNRKGYKACAKTAKIAADTGEAWYKAAKAAGLVD